MSMKSMLIGTESCFRLRIIIMLDVDTGEIIEESEENDGVVDFRQVKQA